MFFVLVVLRLTLVVFVEEGEHELEHALVDAAAFVGPELPLEGLERHDGFGHRAMAAGAADVVEPAAHEVAGVARVAQVADRHDEGVVHDAGDDRPLDVLELQIEVGDVGDEVFARRLAEEGAEHVLHHPAVLPRLDHEVEPLGGDFRALHLADHRGVGQRIEIRESVEIGAVGLRLKNSVSDLIA